MVHAQHPPVHAVEGAEVEAGWQLLLALRERARANGPLAARLGFVLRTGRWIELTSHSAPLANEPHLWLDAAHGSLEQAVGMQPDTVRLFELFTPVVLGPRARTMVMGHLAQSLDGRVATPSGASQFITGREDVLHTHRLRALFDAVIVGVRTVELDDPQLTTRLVTGPHAARVVLDPHGKLAHGRRLLDDGIAPTLVFAAPEALPARSTRGSTEWLQSACSPSGRFDLSALLRRLRERGLARIFVEGGGVTVSGFLAAGLLDRLHVTVAPLILGSGAPAFALPPIDRLEEALPLRCRHHLLGPDLLFDCELAKKPVHSV